jgi:hypothetical protein
MTIDPELFGRIRNVTQSSASSLSTSSYLRQFLLDPNPKKSPFDRVIPWLLHCGTISPQLVISPLYDKYSGFVNTHNASLFNPSIVVRTKESDSIHGDMIRIIS